MKSFLSSSWKSIFGNRVLQIDLLFIFLLTTVFLWVYGSRIWDPDFMFYNDFDGLKNYFTYYYFLIQESPSFLWFEGMNYPYGESIVYTDNTPIVAVLSKAILKTLGMERYGISVFNLWVIASLYLGHIVFYKIARMLDIKPVLCLILGLSVLWICPSFFRLSGHFNLCLLLYLLVPLYYSLKIIKQKEATYNNLFSLAISLIICSLVHVYLFAICGALCGTLAVSYLLLSLISKKGGLKTNSYLVLTIILSGISAFMLLRLLDPFVSIRPEQIMGYNYIEYVVKVKDLFTSNGYFDFFNLYQKLEYPAEDYSFMGSAFLPGLLFILVGTIVFRKKMNSPNLWIALSIAGIMCLIISFGTKIFYDENTRIVNNFLNPLELVMLVSDLPKTLRCINRFVWPFHLVFYILLFYTITIVINNHKKVGWAIAVLFCIPLLLDSYNIISVAKDDFRFDNSFDAIQTSQYHITSSENYEAILPIPYFAVGSESNFEYTINDNSAWSADCYRISVENTLPLMAGKMSRSPIPFVQNLFTLFDQPSNDILNRLDPNKKILIAYDTRNVWPLDESKERLVKLKEDALSLINDPNPCVEYIKQVNHIKFYSYDYGCMASQERK